MNNRMEIASRFANGFLSNPNYIDYISRESKRNSCTDDETIAALSLLYADALIALEAETRKDEVSGVKDRMMQMVANSEGFDNGHTQGFAKGHAQAIEQVKFELAKIIGDEDEQDSRSIERTHILRLFGENISALKPEVKP